MEGSLARCMDDPLSCSACVDEMRGTASTIKTEVLAELNATRKRLHQMASDSVGYNTLTIQVDLPGKGVKSDIAPKAATYKERCFDGMR